MASGLTFNHVSDLNTDKENWKIIVRVVRRWIVNDFSGQKLPFSVELLFVDRKGDRIHGSIRRTLIYKFESQLKEGFVYSIQNFGFAENRGSYRSCRNRLKITFQYQTKVNLADSNVVPADVYAFVPISDLLAGNHDPDYLVDVMGVLTGVGTEREHEKDERKTKMNVIQIEADGRSIECTLFGSYVDELNSFLSSGEVVDTVVILQLAKLKSFRDKIHLQNCMNCTKVVFNCQSEEAINFSKRMLANMESPSQGLSQLMDCKNQTVVEDWLDTSLRKNLSLLKDCNEESSYYVYCTISSIIDDEDWWYTACVCSKAVYADSKMFFCEKCNKHVTKVVLRYRIKLRVLDCTDSAIFVMFDRDASVLLNKSCTELFEAQEKKGAAGLIPDEIMSLVHKSYIFKVDFKKFSSIFPQSYRIKKVCTDEGIIQKFKEVELSDEDNDMDMDNGETNEKNIFPDAQPTMTVVPSVEVAQDLLPKFTGVDMEHFNDSQSEDLTSCDLNDSFDTNNVHESQFCGSVQPTVIGSQATVSKRENTGEVHGNISATNEMDITLKNLKRKIKIEKC